jgi:hypothetical protein
MPGMITASPNDFFSDLRSRLAMRFCAGVWSVSARRGNGADHAVRSEGLR